MTREVADVVVIGGGVMGCAMAYHLGSAGLDVVLLERGELNREASGTNAGTIHLQVRRSEDRAAGRYRLIRESAAAWAELASLFGDEVEIDLHGGLMLAETPTEMAALRDKLRLDESLGLEPQLLTHEQLRALEPQLSSSILGAVRCPHEGSANPLLVTLAFAQHARDAGALIHTHAPVTSLVARKEGFQVETPVVSVQSRRVVCAAGAWTGEVCGLLGLELGVWPCALTVSVTERLPPVLGHVVQHIGRQLSMKQTRQGTVLIGGGWVGAHGGGIDKEVLRDSVLGNAWVALQAMPLLADVRLLRTWTGLLPVTADGRPVVGEHPRCPGLFVLAVPVGAAGYTVAPAITRMLAESITEGTRLPDEFATYAPDGQWDSRRRVG